MMRRRRGMALAITIGVVSLIAILAVATLSLAGRLLQNSTTGIRDARLDAGVAFGLGAAAEEWQQRELGRLAIGSSRSFEAKPSGIPISVSVSVTRVATEIFWVWAEAAESGAVRRENLVLRARSPDAQTLLAEDSTNVDMLGFVMIDSLAAAALTSGSPGAIISPADGVVHITGDATLNGGSGSGVLIVEGRLTISGPVSYEGVIVARGGISVLVPGVTIVGLVRSKGSPPVAGNISVSPNGAIAEDVIRQSLTPKGVAGRRWSEMQ